jgi:hypothetical protein
MITIFTIPKPFMAHMGVIQENAIRSWLAVASNDNVIIFGDELGAVDCAARLDVRHESSVAKNDHNTPLLSDVFKKANRIATTDSLCYVNCDIILTKNILRALSKVQAQFEKFVIVGRRLDVDIDWLIDYTDDREARIIAQAQENGQLHGYSGIDYFLFPKSMYKKIPPFAVGRVGWDNWMIYHAIHLGVPVVDITPFFKAIHQNHDYAHLGGGQKQRDSGEEAKLNLRHAGGWKNLYTIRDATHQLTLQYIRERKGFYSSYRRLVNKTGLYWMYGLYVAMRRMISTGLKR